MRVGARCSCRSLLGGVRAWRSVGLVCRVGSGGARTGAPLCRSTGKGGELWWRLQLRGCLRMGGVRGLSSSSRGCPAGGWARTPGLSFID